MKVSTTSTKVNQMASDKATEATKAPEAVAPVAPEASTKAPEATKAPEGHVVNKAGTEVACQIIMGTKQCLNPAQAEHKWPKGHTCSTHNKVLLRKQAAGKADGYKWASLDKAEAFNGNLWKAS